MKFEDVVGQGHVTQTLRNAIATKRLAHAYLFAGQRGCGKTTTARILAKAVNCPNPIDSNPDNECDLCREITEGRSFDVLEIDGASNRGVEEIRNLRDSVRYPPAKGKYKVYIIDEVHMLTKEAFNALLKTLEEPPSHVLFIFATTEIHKLPPTILSRCQRFDFRRIAIHEIMGNLETIAREEQVTIDQDSLLLIAKRGDGSLRDAQSVFDQIVSLCGREITHQQILSALNIVDQEVYFRVTGLMKSRDAKGALQLVEELMSGGHDIREFLTGLIDHLRNILVAKATQSTDLLEASDVYKKRYMEEAQHFSIPDLLRLQRLVSGTEAAIRWSPQPRFRLEADLIQMTTLPAAVEVADLIQRVEELKKKIGNNPGSTQIPIVSAVPASAPASHSVPRPGTTVPKAPFSRPTFAQSSPVRLPAGQVPAPPQQISITDGELVSRWQELILEIRHQKIALGSVMDSAVPLGVNGDVIRIGCANEFQSSSIKRNRELLGDIIQKVFHSQARIEPEVTPLMQKQASPGTGHPLTGPPGEEHPVIKALMRELGAEPLQ